MEKTGGEIDLKNSMYRVFYLGQIIKFEFPIDHLSGWLSCVLLFCYKGKGHV